MNSPRKRELAKPTERRPPLTTLTLWPSGVICKSMIAHNTSHHLNARTNEHPTQPEAHDATMTSTQLLLTRTFSFFLPSTIPRKHSQDPHPHAAKRKHHDDNDKSKHHPPSPAPVHTKP